MSCCSLASEACEKNHVECLVSIAKSDPSAACEWAVSNGNLETVKILHEAGCLFDEKTMNLAIDHGMIEIVKYLQSIGCGVDEEAFDSAISNGDLEIAKFLHSCGVQPGKWSVTIACANNKFQTLQWLVGIKAPIRKRDLAPIQKALRQGKLENSFMEEKFWELLR